MASNSLFKWMGLGQSTGKPATETDTVDEGERYFGLENFGNTCYSNSVVQALYFCKPFRHCVLNYPVGTLHNQSSQQPLYSPSPSGYSSSPVLNGNGSSNNSNNSNNTYFSQSHSSSTSTLRGGLTTPIKESFSNSLKRSINSNSTSTPHTAISTSISNNGNNNNNGSTIVNGSSSGNGNVAPSVEKDQVNINLAPGMEDTLFSCLKDLFWKISQNKKKTGVIAPINFINKVKKENELFRSSMHQDAHEFFNYLVNQVAEDVEKKQKKDAEEDEKNNNSSGIHSDSSINNNEGSELMTTTTTTTTESSTVNSTVNTKSTWVHQLFEGIFSNETKCLSCETVTSRDESFMDLSIDVEMNSSITSCLRQFSASETLCHKNKYYCDVCSGLQEAERRMKIKKLPNILALHLKRFKYQEQLQKYTKLTYRVVFPFELRLFNTTDDTEDADRMYELWAIVVHIGSGPHHGHYVSVIKSNGRWMLFDDDTVTQIQEEDIQKYFADLPGSGSGYVLFYQAVDLDIDSFNGIGQQIVTYGKKLDDMNVSSSSTNTNNGRPLLHQHHPSISISSNSSHSPRLETDMNNYNISNSSIENSNTNHFSSLQSPTAARSSRKDDFSSTAHIEIPSSVSTPPLHVPTPQPEEKKTRWGLGRKKKDKK